MKFDAYQLRHGYSRGTAYLFSLLCFMGSSLAPSPQLVHGTVPLVPVTGSEEFPAEENQTGPNLLQEIVSEPRRGRRDQRAALQSAFESARGGSTAPNIRPQMAYLFSQEYGLRFGLGTPLRI